MTVEHHHPTPVNRRLWTPGVGVLLLLSAIGACVFFGRFIFGLAKVTNLDNQHPWGLWIAIDVATGVALAAGGFMTAALAHVFHREHYHAVVRPALLTAMLGYTFVGIGLMADLGRYYNIWHPAWPTMWSPNSVLFEVGMCVMCYLTVLYLEFAPIVCERLMKEERWPRARRLADQLHAVLKPVMPFLIVAGVVLSCLHQSSLGNLITIAPTKYHPLWWTPISALLFLLSAFAVGYAMVIFESMYAAWSLKLKPEMHILTPLSRYLVFFVGFYLAFKVGDMMIRESYRAMTVSWTTGLFLLEIGGGLVLPLLLLLRAGVRRSPRGLFVAALLVVLGVALNRVNVFLVAYHSVYYPDHLYFPSLGEFAVTIGLISFLIFLYRVLVTYLPVIAHEPHARTV